MPAGWPVGYSLVVPGSGGTVSLRRYRERTPIIEMPMGTPSTTAETMRLRDVAAF